MLPVYYAYCERQSIHILISQIVFYSRNWSSPKYDKLNSLTSSEMRQLLLDIAPKPEQAISMAMFNGQPITNVTEEFPQIYTDSGKLI